jgi:GNAT superfamily N-acetyltransferase
MIFASFPLAARIEHADAMNAAQAVESYARLHPDSGAEARPAGGGLATFASPGSPMTHALGLGMNGPVTDADIDGIEEFYRGRGCSSVNIDLCPLADASLCEGLGRRCYRIVEYNNVLVRRVAKYDAWPGDSRVRQAGAGDLDLWSRTVMGGFFEKAEPAPEEADIGATLFGMEGAAAFIAAVAASPAAGAAMSIREGLAFLFGDSTLTGFRGRGLHRSLIEARLARAVAAGCDLAAAATLPGTISQRNYERCGFQVLYTKMNMQRDF